MSSVGLGVEGLKEPVECSKLGVSQLAEPK